MAEAVGLSIGATRFAGVQPGRAPVTRQSVLTLYAHRSPELGVPGENPNLTEPGQVMAGFVDRVGDPVGMVAADGSVHRGELLVADALRELLYTVSGGRPPAAPPTVTYPAHWRKAQVDALRAALTHVPEWSRRGQVTLVSDAVAAMSALQSDPGVPSRGVIALCDFGGTGTSITLLDAGRGYAPVGPTVRHPDFSGDMVDQALLAHVVSGLSLAGTLGRAGDATGTSALGPLNRLRGQCRAAKERLSAASVTTLSVDLPGFAGDVRLTRAELEDEIRRPLTEVVQVVQAAIDRSGVRPGDLVAVASVGGCARIPLVTELLSERFRVPVITTAHPELAAAGGAALRAAVGPASIAATVAAPVAAPSFADADAASTTFRALAWSEAHDVPPLAPAVEPYDEPATGLTSARPQFEFDVAPTPVVADAPWYRRRSPLLGVAASVLVLLGTSAVVAFGSESTPASSTAPPAPSSSLAPAAAPPADGPVQEAPQDPPPRTLYAVPAPATRYQAPAQQQAAAPPAAPAAPAPAATPSSQAPPPPTPETTTVTSTTQAPPSTTTVTAPPPTTQQPEPTQAPAPTTTQPPVTFTLPPLPSIPGLFAPQPNR